MKFESEVKRILCEYLPVFAGISEGGATFDEFLLVREGELGHGQVTPLCVVPSRSEAEGFGYGPEVAKVTKAYLDMKRPAGRLGFVVVEDADGLDFDGMMFLPGKNVLFVNSKRHTVASLKKAGTWDSVEAVFSEMVSEINAAFYGADWTRPDCFRPFFTPERKTFEVSWRSMGRSRAKTWIGERNA